MHYCKKGGIIPFAKTGKQVQLLYEPVAVRYSKKNSFPCPMPQIGDRSLEIFSPRRRKRMYRVEIPDWQMPPKNIARASERGEKNFFTKENTKMQKTVFFKLLCAFLCVVLVAATALFATGCNDSNHTDSSTDSAVSKVQSELPQTTSSESKAESGTASAEVSSPEASAEVSSPEDGKTHLGTGSKSFDFDVTDADGNTTHFVVSTDKDTVGDALLELGLIAGEEGAYGLYVKTVNGLTIDYDTHGKYWAFYVNGEYGMAGVDTTEIVPDTLYAFVVE